MYDTNVIDEKRHKKQIRRSVCKIDESEFEVLHKASTYNSKSLFAFSLQVSQNSMNDDVKLRKKRQAIEIHRNEAEITQDVQTKIAQKNTHFSMCFVFCFATSVEVFVFEDRESSLRKANEKIGRGKMNVDGHFGFCVPLDPHFFVNSPK